jgi:hypothetical protein
MIFSTPTTIVLTGLKHGSTQLSYTAHNYLGLPYFHDKASHSTEFIRPFNYKKLYYYIEEGFYGDELMKIMDLPTSNVNYNKINYVKDLSFYKEKPLVVLIRDPKKAAESSIIEDLQMFLNSHAGILASKSKSVRKIFLASRQKEITKKMLEDYPYVEELFFDLNFLAMEEDSYNFETVFRHTEYLHLNNVSNVLEFLALRKNVHNVINNTLLVNIDEKYNKGILDILHENKVLINDLPNYSMHSTSNLIKKLPNFFEKLNNMNVLYRRRLESETALYSFLHSAYPTNIFHLDRYIEILNTFQEESNKPFDESKIFKAKKIFYLD